MCREQKVAVLSKFKQSGIVQGLKDTNQLLDELLHERMEKYLQRSKGKKETNAREKTFFTAEEEIVETATSKTTKQTTKTVYDAARSSKTFKKKRVGCEDVEDFNEMIKSELTS